MAVSKPGQSFYIFIAFLFALGAAVYLYIQNTELKARIDKFVPAAIDLDNENKMLLDTKRQLLEELTNCAAFKDSLSGSNIKASVQKGMNMEIVPTNPGMQPGLPATPAPYSPGSDYKDLNKGQ